MELKVFFFGGGERMSIINVVFHVEFMENLLANSSWSFKASYEEMRKKFLVISFVEVDKM